MKKPESNLYEHGVEGIPIGTSYVPTQQSRRGLLYVSIAVLCFASSPVFVTWSRPFSPVEIAFWRLALATGLVALLGCLTRQPLLITRRQLPRFLFYGLVTALHFFLYIVSLNFTTPAHALALTYTSPIFVALFSVIILREGLSIRKSAGILVAVVGIVIMTGFEPRMNGSMLFGDGMALLSALCYGIYSIAGRGERDRHPLFRYTTNVYGFAALWLLPVALLEALLQPHAYPAQAVSSVVILGVLPLGLGHTLYNAAIRRVHATYANVIATQEVTLGVLLSAIFLHAIPSPTSIVGGIVTLLGVVGVLI